MTARLLCEAFTRSTLVDAWNVATRRPYLRADIESALVGGGIDHFLTLLREDVLSRRYRPSEPMLTDWSPGRSVERLSLQDWIVQWVVRRALTPTIDAVLMPNCCAYRPHYTERRFLHVAMAAQQRGLTWFAYADVLRYFASIDRNQLLSLLVEAGVPSELTELVMLCLSASRLPGLPTGHLLSNVLANLYLSDLDRAHDLQPSLRYCDDILLPRPTFEGATVAMERVTAHLLGLGLTINTDKSTVISSPNVSKLLGWSK